MATKSILIIIAWILTTVITRTCFASESGTTSNQHNTICRNEYYEAEYTNEDNTETEVFVDIENLDDNIANPSSLQNLEIRDSNIPKIYDDSFNNFTNLVQLKLINCNVVQISTNSFGNLVNLRYLDLSYNQISNLNSAIFKNNLNLTILILNHNRFATLDALIPCLKSVTKLRELHIGNNSLTGDITTWTTTCVQHLKVLDVSYNKITVPNFENFTNLCEINIGGNRYTTEDLTKILSTLNRTSVKALILGNSVKGEISKTNQYPIIYEDTFPVFPNLEYLDLTNAQIADIRNNSFKGKMLQLKTLILRHHFLNEIPNELRGCPHLIHLDITYGQSRQEEFNLKTNVNYDMPNLETLDLSANKISLVPANSFTGLPNLKSLQLTDCQIVKLEPFAFNNLPRLKTLNISHNLMDEIVNDTFANLDELETLILDRNNLKVYPHNDPFVKLYKMKLLSFRYNSLCEIWWYLLRNQINLEYMDGRDNKLESWKIRALYNTTKLRTILLQKNEITKVSQPMLIDLVNIPHVELWDNPFNCSDCDLAQTQNWIQNRSKPSDFRLFKCLHGNKTGVNYLINATLPVSCHVPITKQSLVLPISITSVVLILITLTIIYTAYRLRWFTRYYYYVFCIRGKPQLNNGDYLYDAYISYSKKDSDWLNDTFLKNLENNRTKLKFYVRERDNEVGHHVIDNILEGMEHSRYFVALVSDNYLKSCWRMWELKLAVSRAVKEYNPNIIVINLDGSSERATNKSVKHAIATQVYLNWSEESIKQKVVMEKITQKLSCQVRSSQGIISHV